MRLCIQISYDRPLIKLIKVGGISQSVQYEGISSLCFSCGRVGHKEESCPYRARATKKADGDDANGENLEGKKSTPNDKSYPTKENFGSWVLVARKKKVNKDFGKDKLSSYGHLSPFKPGPSQTKSLTRSGFAYLKTEKRSRSHNHMTLPTPNALLANHTISITGEDQPNLTQHHMSSKSHTCGQKTKQKSWNLARAKGNQVSTSDKEKESRISAKTSNKPTKMPMTEWRLTGQPPLWFKAFTAGGSKHDGLKGEADLDPNKSLGVETEDISMDFEDIETTLPLVKVPLRDISIQDHGRNGELAMLQSIAAENISRANLKRIDPTLRSRPEANLTHVGNASYSPEGNEDSMQADSRSGHDADGMQFDEGSDLHLS